MANTRPVKGTRDFLPSVVRQRNYVMSVVREVYEAHGFEPLETPSFERLDTLLGKYGDEGDQLVFRIMKRGADLGRALGREEVSQETLANLGLRYDLTVPLARVVAAYQNDLPKVFKRYQIQPVWRADRPQRGRFREFYQCDVDVVGSRDLVADAEVMSALATVLQRLGFDRARLRLNHRGVLSGLLEVAGIPSDLEGAALVAIDKLDKIGWEGVESELAGRGITPEAIVALGPLLELATGTNDHTLEALADALRTSARGSEGVAGLRELVELSAASPAGAIVEVDPYLARGLSYYTGPIFEIASPDFAGSLGGGGRYDNLVGMFLGRQVPAVGFSLGLERICVLMDEGKMFPDVGCSTDVMVAQMNSETRSEAVKLASELRATGLRVDLQTDAVKLKKQFKLASERAVPFVVLLGPDEVRDGTVAVKNMGTGQQRAVARPEVAEQLRRALQVR